jgi:threonine dehydrogenase-like Zn-dependent dehydrogenase
MGPYKGGQAEYLRVPFADFNCLKLPPGTEHESDFVLLADIFPTGYHGCELARVGRLFEKGLRIGTGQANVKQYNRQLRGLMIEGRATPSFVVSHELPLEAAPDAYRKFDQRIEGYTKVILKPAA